MRRVAAVVALLAAAWTGYGLSVRARRAPRPPPPPGEVRGAYHVHTDRSDGRGSLDDVVRAARRAGLQFVVVADHNVLSLEDQGWRDGVLVVEGTEISAPYGHVVGLGLPRELTKEERHRDTLGTIRALGGRAVLAHPFHPRRPFTRWSRSDFSGLEVVSNDSLWGWTWRRRNLGRMALAALDLPWDPARAQLDLWSPPEQELSRYDALERGAPRALFCAVDAHGWPSYRAAFEAFSMHLPLRPTGDGAADARAVVDRLLDGSAACVFDGVAPASGVALALAPSGDRLVLSFSTPDPSGAAFRLFRDGKPFGAFAPGPGGGSFDCAGPCPRPAAWRVEGEYRGRPWIFTNPVRIE